MRLWAKRAIPWSKKDVIRTLNLMKNLKIFYLLALHSLKTTFQGRVGAVFFLLGKIVRVAFIFIFIALVFSRTNLIKGYNLNQILLFYLTYNIIDTLSQILYREVYRFRPLVVSGGFDLILLKPFHPFIRILVGGMDFLDALLIIPYILAALYIYITGFHGDFIHFLIYLAFLFNSMLLVTAFHIIVLCIGIITSEVDHTIMIYRDITSLGRFPMDIYKEPVRGLFTFIIPIGVMMTVPSQALMGILSLPIAVFSFLVSCSLLGLSLLFWQFALKRYQSWGG